MVLRPGPRCEEAETISPPALFYSHNLLGAAVSPFNLGQTDGDSVCGDCITISNPDEGCSFGARTDELLQRGRVEEGADKGRQTKAASSLIFLITAYSLLLFLSLSPRCCWLLFFFSSSLSVSLYY